jgi:hypothetical protein
MIVTIEPVQAKYTSDDMAGKLEISIILDDLVSVANTNWALKMNDDTVLDSGNIPLSEEVYSSWDRSPDWLVAYVAETLGLTIIEK